MMAEMVVPKIQDFESRMGSSESIMDLVILLLLPYRSIIEKIFNQVYSILWTMKVTLVIMRKDQV